MFVQLSVSLNTVFGSVASKLSRASVRNPSPFLLLSSNKTLSKVLNYEYTQFV